MKQTHLAASYMKQFQCTGSACEDTCCQGWSVDIDKKTFVKYKDLQDKTWKRKLASHIRRNRYETTYSSYATIRFPEQGCCPFLNTEKLCSVQLALGERYLSRTCKLYPRQHARLYDSYELTGSLSCPEVARLALLNPDGIRLEPIESVCEDDTQLDRLFEADGLSDAFHEVRQFLVQLLQTRSLSLVQRLMRLGWFAKALTSLLEDGQDEQILMLVSRFRAEATDGNTPPPSRTVSDFPLQLLTYLVEDYAAHANNSARYKASYQRAMNGINGSHSRYVDAYASVFAPFLREHGYVMENYLVNYVISRLFPFYGNRTPYEEWIILVLHYALIQLHLVGIAAEQQSLSPEEAVSFIQTFARTFEHDTSYFQKALSILQEQGLTELDDLEQLLAI